MIVDKDGQNPYNTVICQHQNELVMYFNESFLGSRSKRKKTLIKHRLSRSWHKRKNSASLYDTNLILEYQNFAAKLIIKRIYRGNTHLQGQLVIVEGLGNPNLCVSRPRR